MDIVEYALLNQALATKEATQKTETVLRDLSDYALSELADMTLTEIAEARLNLLGAIDPYKNDDLDSLTLEQIDYLVIMYTQEAYQKRLAQMVLLECMDIIM